MDNQSLVMIVDIVLFSLGVPFDFKFPVSAVSWILIDKGSVRMCVYMCGCVRNARHELDDVPNWLISLEEVGQPVL